jgi:hypothetical protein
MPVSISAAEAAPSLLDRGEKLYSPAGVAKASNIPGHRGGTHINGSTIFRFITKGKRVNGEVIRLEAVRVGDRWLTSLEALARFAERLTAAELGAAGAAFEAPVSPRQRIRQQEVASRRLNALLAKKK